MVAAPMPIDPDRKHTIKLVAMIGVVVLAIAGVIVAIVVSSHPADGVDAKPDMVQIEVRAKPRVQVRYAGHIIGRAPVKVVVPRSTESVLIEVAAGHPMITTTIIPDHDQVVDLTDRH